MNYNSIWENIIKMKRLEIILSFDEVFELFISSLKIVHFSHIKTDRKTTEKLEIMHTNNIYELTRSFIKPINSSAESVYTHVYNKWHLHDDHIPLNESEKEYLNTLLNELSENIQLKKLEVVD